MKHIVKTIPGTLQARLEAIRKTEPVLPKDDPELVKVDTCKSHKDHIVGITYDYEETDLVTKFSAAKDTEYFRFCPKCGIDLAATVRNLWRERKNNYNE